MNHLVLKYSLILVSIFCSNEFLFSYEKNSPSDSLTTILINKRGGASFETDTLIINTYNTLAWDVSQRNPDSSILLANESVKIANEFLKKEKMDLAIYLQQKQPSISQNQKWSIVAIAQSFHYLGEFYRLKGDYPKAIENSLKALTIWDKINEKAIYGKKSATLANIGIFYTEQGDYSKALAYYNVALNIDKSINDSIGIAADMGNMAIVFAEQKNYTQALHFLLEALEINEALGNTKGIASKLGNIGIIYKRQAEELLQARNKSNQKMIDSLFEQALDYSNKAQLINEKLGNKHGVAINLGNIGVLYFQRKNFRKAEEYYLKALSIDSTIGFKAHEIDLYNSIYQLYDSTQNTKKAYFFYKKFIEGRDSLNNESSMKKMLETQIKYDFEKREIEQRAEQDKKDVILQQEKKRQNIIINSISCVLILLVFIVIYVFKSYKQKQRSNIEITNQKQLIEQKQKEILDSIRYAKRIQSSILPNENYISRSLKKLNKKS